MPPHARNPQRRPPTGEEPPPAPKGPSRFMLMDDVAEELSITLSQTYALVRSGALPAIKVGGRGQWRIERSRLEDFIKDAYESTAQFVAQHPLVSPDPPSILV